MEKFFIVTEESHIHKEYFDYLKNEKEVNEVVKTVMQENEMETTTYGIDTNSFYIIPTKNDLDKFFGQMKKGCYVGCLCEFKKNSPIFKEVFKRLSEKNLKVIRRPSIQWEFPYSGRSSHRLFSIEDTLYASFKIDGEITVIPKGFTEIKGSEFYNAIEEYEEKVKNNE